MVDHFMNTAVYACIIEQLIDFTDSKSKCKLHWNQNCILYLERGAAVLMNIEIWKRFIYKRDELFKNADAKLMQAIKLVRELIHEDNTPLSFHSEIEKSITKATSEEKITATLELEKTTKKNNTNATTQEKSKKRKFKIPYAKRKNKITVIRSHIEFPSKAEMVGTMGQKNTMMDSSVLTRD